MGQLRLKLFLKSILMILAFVSSCAMSLKLYFFADFNHPIKSAHHLAVSVLQQQQPAIQGKTSALGCALCNAPARTILSIRF